MGYREDYVARYGEETGNAIADQVDKGIYNEETSDRADPSDGYQAATDEAIQSWNLTEEDIRGPQDFDASPGYVSWEDRQRIQKENDWLTTDEWEAQARAGFLANRQAAPFDLVWKQRALKPDADEYTLQRAQSIDELYSMVQEEYPELNFNQPAMYTSIDLFSSLASGYAIDHKIAADAAIALFEENRAELEAARNNFTVSQFRLEQDEDWLNFANDIGEVLGDEGIVDNFVFLFDRNIDKEGIRAAIGQTMMEARAGRKEGESHQMYKDRILFYWQNAVGAASNRHMFKTGQLEQEGTGWGTAWKGFVQANEGVWDFLLPEAAEESVFGRDLDGGIVQGLTQPLGALASTPIISEVFQAAEFMLKPAEVFLTDSVESAISWFAGEVTDDPYRAMLTDGQNIALGMGLDWGTDWFNNMSGVFDAGIVLATDPLTYVIPAGKAAKLRAVVPLTEEFAQMSRLRRGLQAYTPKWAQKSLWGSVTPTPWKGPKGMLTRAFYYTTAKPFDDLLKMGGLLDKIPGGKARHWKGFIDDAVEFIQDGRGAELENNYTFLNRSQGMLGALEEFIPKAVEAGVDPHMVARQIIHDAAYGLLNDGDAVGKTADMANRNVQISENAYNQRLRQAIESGEISPREVPLLTLGDHAWDPYAAVRIGDDGVASVVPLLEDGAEVVLFPKKVKFATIDAVLAKADEVGGAPPLFVRSLREAEDVATVWSQLGDVQRNRALRWLHSNGFDGVKLGNNRYALTPQKIADGITAVDGPIRRQGGVVMGPAANDLARARRVRADLLGGTDDMRWIIDSPFNSLSKEFYLDFKKGLAWAGRTVSSERAQAIGRRVKSELLTRIDGFPTSVDWTDVNRGSEAIRLMAERSGLKAEKINDMVARFRNANVKDRRMLAITLKDEIDTITGNWQSQYLHRVKNPDIDFKAGVNAQGEAYALGKSNHSDDIVEIAFEPHMMSKEVFWYGPDHWGELARLQRAQTLPGRIAQRVGGVGPLKARKTRKNRERLADRMKEWVADKAGPEVAEGIAREDYYNMAYAQIADFANGEKGLNGLGRISQVSRFMGRWHRLMVSQFSIHQLVQRFPGWSGKVAIFEETQRGHLTGATRWFQNPVGALREATQASYIRGIRKNADKVGVILTDMRDTVVRSFDGLPLDEAIERANRILPNMNTNKINSLVDLRRAVTREVTRELNNFNPTLNGVVDISKEAQRTAAQIQALGKGKGFRGILGGALDEVEDFGDTLDDVMSYGTARNTLGDEVEIFNNSLFDEHARAVDSTRAYNPLAFDEDSIEAYSFTKGTKAVDEANDPWHRVAVEWHLAELTGGTKPNLTSIAMTTKWEVLRPNIQRIAQHRGYRWSSQEDLIRWYIETFQREVIDARWGGLWEDFADVTRAEVLQGILDREIFVAGIRIPLTEGHVTTTRKAYRQLMDKARGEGNTLPHWERNVVAGYNPQRARGPQGDWLAYNHVQRAATGVNRGLRLVDRPMADGQIRRGILHYAGASATENISRLPGWRNLYREYRRTYRGMGLSDEAADAAARMNATETINNIFYNSKDMPKAMSKYNDIIPFGAAMVEVARVWMWDIPKAIGGRGLSGWTLGAVATGRKWDYLIRSLESMGLLEMREGDDGKWRHTLVFSSEEGNTWQSQAGFAVFSTPAALITKISENIGIEGLDNYESLEWKLGNPIGNPFDPTNEGLFQFGQFQVGMEPTMAWALNTLAPTRGIFNPERVREFEGGTLEQFLAQQDNMDLETFLSIPSNRIALAEAGFPMDKVQDFLAFANDDEFRQEGVDLLETIASIKDFELPEGTYSGKQEGVWWDLLEDYMFPYGAPANPAQVIGGYTPAVTQSLIMGLETLLDDNDAYSVSAQFFGPQAAYRQEANLIEGIMMNAVVGGAFEKWQEKVDEGAALVDRIIADGLAVWDEDNEGELKWADDWEDVDNARSAKALLEEVTEQQQALYGEIVEDALGYAAGKHFQKWAMQLTLPASPRAYTSEENDRRRFWASKDMAESIRMLDDTDAWRRWGNYMKTPEQATQFMGVVNDFLSPPRWDPDADDRQASYLYNLNRTSDVKRAFLNNPAFEHLHMWLTPTKVYPAGYLMTENVEEWAEAVENDLLRWASPELFFMRAASSAVSWEAGVEQAAWWGDEDFTKALDNKDEYSDMIQSVRNRYDYIDFFDAEIFGGVLAKSYEEANELREGKVDEEIVIREQLMKEYKRDLALIGRIEDDIESYVTDPIEAKEMTQALYGIRDMIELQIMRGGELDTYNARLPQERDLDTYYDTVINPYYSELAVLYDDVNKAESDYARTMAYERIRAHKNEHFKSMFEIGGVEAPNALKASLDRYIREAQESGPRGSRLEERAIKALTKKPDWISMDDVAAISAYVGLIPEGSLEQAKEYLPTEPVDWVLYRIRNEAYAEIEQARKDGEIDQKTAQNLKEAHDEIMLEKLIEQGRENEALFLDFTPSEKLFNLGVLPDSLLPIHATAMEYVEEIRRLDESKIRHNKKNIWLQETNPIIRDYVASNASARSLLLQIGALLYDSTDLDDITYRFFLGKYSDV